MINIKSQYLASCHCAAEQFKLILKNGLVDLRRCDCSMCPRRGAIVTSVTLYGKKSPKAKICCRYVNSIR